MTNKKIKTYKLGSGSGSITLMESGQIKYSNNKACNDLISILELNNKNSKRSFKYSKIPELKDFNEKIQFFNEIPLSKEEYYKSDIWGLANNIIQELQKVFNDWLEVEYYNKSEGYRMSLRKSAIKQASKMFKRLQELGHYK